MTRIATRIGGVDFGPYRQHPPLPLPDPPRPRIYFFRIGRVPRIGFRWRALFCVLSIGAIAAYAVIGVAALLFAFAFIL